MSITSKGSSRWLVRVRSRINGRMVEKKATITGSRNDAKAAEVQLRKELAEIAAGAARSLTIRTFGEALTYFREHTTSKLDSIQWHLTKLETDLGTVPVRDLSQRFEEYLILLKSERSQRTGELLSPVTRNRLLVYGKCALSLCLKRGLIDRNPLKGFDMVPEEARDRILSEDEQTRLLDALKRNDSYLYWPVRFSLKNPIRKSDLISLTRENLNRFDQYVHFLPSKTARRKQKEACLECVDSDLLEYFDSLPPECPFLFPQGIRNGEYVPLGDFKKHWHSMLTEARINDFRWHDLKHCAITFMIDAGYSILDLKNLGIQFSAEMVERYYNFSAKKVIGKYRSIQKNPLEKQQKTAT